MPSIANPVIDALDRGWHYATLFFGETQIRTGHILVALLKSTELRRALVGLSKLFGEIPADDLMAQHRTLWAQSAEENLQPARRLRPAGGGHRRCVRRGPEGHHGGSTASRKI